MRRGLLRAHVWLTATAVPLLVRLLPLRLVLRALTPPHALRPYAGVDGETIAGIVERRLARPRNMRRRACLRKGLVLFHFLRLAGLPAVLRFGVYPEGTHPRRALAHCWVECDGVRTRDLPDGPVAIVLNHGVGRD